MFLLVDKTLKDSKYAQNILEKLNPYCLILTLP